MYNVDYRTLRICFHEVDCKLSVETDFYSTIKFDSKDDAKQVYNKLIDCEEFRVNNDCDLFCTTIAITGDATVSYDSINKSLIILVMN